MANRNAPDAAQEGRRHEGWLVKHKEGPGEGLALAVTLTSLVPLASQFDLSQP